ncbi:hypothetical protein ACKI1I_39560 [Streptomyces turgidiscabies]|uniref:Uncharacterized protein n=1 Tax=Streptomyces turgidiscabies (strain Car8) TaxID=698760 RepID=L7EUV2_STRT8|nr:MULTISPECIES: hypothetical protein [Streptomyces]ELP62634.1 hypothetical protein STRTUCAR8_04167 [Streptomyces turgidiscabies Car8]MDX3497574.1 hypothetical protein [Streptomyces turgidiscabies]GAQ76134.1 hypothetical protein T45_07923 [Streptomyces turgidiscabies]
MEVVPRRVPDLAAAPPADRPVAARDTRSVRDYWRWVIAHQVDVSTLPPQTPRPEARSRVTLPHGA